MGQNVECKNIAWDKTSTGTKVKWDKMSNGNMERKICVNIFGFLLLLSDYMGMGIGMYSNVENMVKNVENVRGNVCI